MKVLEFKALLRCSAAMLEVLKLLLVGRLDVRIVRDGRDQGNAWGRLSVASCGRHPWNSLHFGWARRWKFSVGGGDDVSRSGTWPVRGVCPSRRAERSKIGLGSRVAVNRECAVHRLFRADLRRLGKKMAQDKRTAVGTRGAPVKLVGRSCT